MKTYNNPISLAVDQFLNHNLSDVLGVDLATKRPFANMHEENNQFVLDIAIPGVKKEDINIEVKGDMLKVSAETKQETENEDKENSFIRREFNYSSFERTFRLDETANKEKISAAYDAGVLTLTIAKKEEAVDNGPINIKVS